MVYLVTERVEPLQNRLSSKLGSEDVVKIDLYFSWGIFQVTVCIKFCFFYIIYNILIHIF